MTADQPMFEVASPPVQRPKFRPSLPGKPRWVRYRAVRPHKCDDCLVVLYEAVGAPLARQARYRRVTATGDRLLCHGHAQQWREDDSLPPLSRGQKRDG